jgi:coenzyme PQQ synthesis protein D (PqqD)
MELTNSYEPAGQDIVSEEIDGEVIIVNLKNGNYYSLTHSATVIWAGIQEHATLEQIRDRLLVRYTGDTASIRQGLVELIKALEAEQLITQRSAAEETSPVDGSTPAELPVGEKETYLPPVFERFTDMGDLLLLDPVHEVEDEKGWPHAKRNP